MNEIVLRPAERTDILQVVEVHLESFRGFFLSSLGPGFLRVFYESLCLVDQGILLVAVIDDEVVGFVGGATDQVGLYRAMLAKRKLQFIYAATVAAIRRPAAIRRLVRARRRAQGEIDYMPGASLMTLGVSPTHGRKGIGGRLVAAFSATLAETGVAQFSLTTDAIENDGVNHFYLSLGFTLERVLVTGEGRRLNEYVRSTS